MQPAEQHSPVLASAQRRADDATFAFVSNLLNHLATAARRPDGMLGRRVRSTFHGLCSMVNPTIAVEIGAYEAGFSRWAGGALPDCRVIAFEANPYAWSKFRGEFAGRNVEYLNVCIGATNGKVTLNIPTDVRGVPRELTNQMASLQRKHGTIGYEVVEVDGVRLDDVVRPGPDDVVVLWIDVEGATEAVFAGGQEVLERARAIFIEVEALPTWEGQWLDDDVARHLRSLGFVPIMRDCQRPHQYNVVFVTEDLARSPDVARSVSDVYLRLDPRPGPPAGASRGTTRA